MNRISGRNNYGSFVKVYSAKNVRRIRLRCVFFILGLIVFAAAQTVSAKQGDLDPAFGNGGKVITDFAAGDDCRLVALDMLHEAPAIGRHVVDELGFVQPQTLEIDQVDVGAQSGRKSATVG